MIVLVIVWGLAFVLVKKFSFVAATLLSFGIRTLCMQAGSCVMLAVTDAVGDILIILMPYPYIGNYRRVGARGLV